MKFLIWNVIKLVLFEKPLKCMRDVVNNTDEA